MIINMQISLNVDRNSQDFRGRQQGALRRVNKSLVWKPSWGNVKVQLLSMAEGELCLAVVIHCLFWLFKLTPIISDPEYLLDQHILICVKSTDSDESYGKECADSLWATDARNWAILTGCWCVIFKGEGCVALRAAQFCYTEFQVTLTHHGEKTGVLTGGIQLHTSEGKTTEKLYGESGNQLGTCLFSLLSTSALKVTIPVLLCIQISSKLRRMTLSLQNAKAATSISEIFFPSVGYIRISQTWFPAYIFCLLVDRFSTTQAHDISNPNYMVGMAFKAGSVIDKGWSYSMPPKNVPTAGQVGKDSKKPGYDVGARSPPGKPSPL